VREVTEQVRLRVDKRLPDFVTRAAALAHDELDRLDTTPAGRP
jgi:hypothetical protein